MMMNVFAAMMFVALGIALDEVHNYICHKHFKNGYEQAQKEEKIRKEATEKKGHRETHPIYPESDAYGLKPIPRAVPHMPIDSNMNNVKSNNIVFPESFVSDFNNNGKAVCKLNKGAQ